LDTLYQWFAVICAADHIGAQGGAAAAAAAAATNEESEQDIFALQQIAYLVHP
jgi:hypothetical protein